MESPVPDERISCTGRDVLLQLVELGGDTSWVFRSALLAFDVLVDNSPLVPTRQRAHGDNSRLVLVLAYAVHCSFCLTNIVGHSRLDVSKRPRVASQ